MFSTSMTRCLGRLWLWQITKVELETKPFFTDVIASAARDI